MVLSIGADLDQELDRLHQGVQQLQAGQQQLQVSVGQLQANVGQLQADAGQLQAGQQQLQANVGQLQASVGQLQAGQQQLQANVGQLQANVGQLQVDVGQLQAGQQQLILLLNARLPPLNGNGAQCHAVTILAARDHNSWSPRWVPVPNNAGNVPNQFPTSRSAVNRMTITALTGLLQHYGVAVPQTRSEMQQTLIALLSKG